MELRESEPLGVLDDHQRRVGDVDPDLDHGGGDEDVKSGFPERRHRRVLLRRGHPTVHEPHTELGQDLAELARGVLRGAAGDRVGLLDGGADPVRLLAAPAGPADAGHDLGAAPGGRHRGADRSPSRRKLVDDRDVEIGVRGHGEGARDRGGGHDELMRAQCAALALAAQCEPLLDPEAVLLVDDDEPEVRERHVRLEQRVRSHRDRGLAAGDAGQDPAALAAPEAAGEPGHLDPERLEPAPEAREVLLREQLGGRHQGDLALAGHRRHRGDGRDHRLAGAHVALHQPVHRPGPGEVGTHLPRHPALRGGQLERQRVDEAAHRRVAAVERRGVPAVDAAPHQAQRQVVREQLLEREAPPRRVREVERRPGACARRWPVDRAQGVDEAGETVAHRHLSGQQVGDVGTALEPIECLPGQASEQRLAQPRGRGIDRGQAVGGRRLGVVVEQPVLRVRGLDAAGRGVHLSVAGDAPPRAELPPLVLVEVEQPHRHRPGAVADGDHEGAAPPEAHVGALDPAACERGVSGTQVSDRVDTGAVLVSKRQVEQQVQDRLDPEPRELLGDRGTDAAKLRHRRGLERRRSGG